MLSRYCHRCRGVKPANHRHKVTTYRPSGWERGYDSKWVKTRTEYLRAFPACQHRRTYERNGNTIEEACLVPASEVHHLDGKGPKGEKGHDWGNLQGLCKPHHSAITAKEKPSGFARP